MVFATLVDRAGAPLAGVSVVDIQLLSADLLPVGMGPYVFGAGGDIVDNGTLSVTASFNGRSRVAFLDVPVGTLTLRANLLIDGSVETRSVQVDHHFGEHHVGPAIGAGVVTGKPLPEFRLLKDEP